MKIDRDRNHEGGREQREGETSRAKPSDEQDQCQTQELRGKFHSVSALYCRVTG